VDEAHNLEENVTRSLEFRLDPISVRRQLADLGGTNSGLLGEILASTKTALPANYYGQIERFVANITDTLPKMHQHIDTLFNDLRSFLEATNSLRSSDYLLQVRLTNTLRNKPAFSQVKAAWGILSQFIEAMSDAMSKLNGSFTTLRARFEIHYIDDLIYGTRTASQHLSTLYRQLNEIIVAPDDNTIYWIEISPDQEVMSIHGAPLSVGPLVKRALWDARKTATNNPP
jgi:Rad3-related DNA helicase